VPSLARGALAHAEDAEARDRHLVSLLQRTGNHAVGRMEDGVYRSGGVLAGHVHLLAKGVDHLRSIHSDLQVVVDGAIKSGGGDGVLHPLVRSVSAVLRSVSAPLRDTRWHTVMCSAPKRNGDMRKIQSPER